MIWGFWKKEYKFALTGISICATIGLIAGGVYGFQQYLEYPSVLSYLSHHGESLWQNQSINGLMNRITGNGLSSQLIWFPPYNPTVYFATVISSLLMLIMVFAWRWRKAATESDLGLVLITLTIASPIAWEHHYGVLLGVMAVWVPQLSFIKPLGKLTLAAVAVLWIFVGQNFPIIERITMGRPIPELLLNHLLFGALAITALWIASATRVEHNG